ncbi:MAG: NOG1 family protein [Thermoplasmatota archaeon]
MDKANRRAKRVQISDPDYRFRMQKLNRSKVESFAGVIDSTLESYVKAFPSFNNLDPFYVALIDLMVSIDDIKRILGRIDGVRKQVTIIKAKVVRQIDRTSKAPYMEMKRKEAFGRISSMVKDLEQDLSTLAFARERFKELPSIPTKHPTAVVAGYPSVGKSQLVKSISTADPKVASYPFTTQELTVGYFDMDRSRYQIIDTPGLLDRPFEERNRIEKQAILALTLLTHTCIYMIDPTGHCGYPLEPQLELLKGLAESVPDMDFIILVNKSDLDLPEGVVLDPVDETADQLKEQCTALISISATDGTGLDELRSLIKETLLLEEEKPWEDYSGPD